MKLNYIKIGDYYYPNLYLEFKNNYKIVSVKSFVVNN